jgi:hypothetical protein
VIPDFGGKMMLQPIAAGEIKVIFIGYTDA